MKRSRRDGPGIGGHRGPGGGTGGKALGPPVQREGTWEKNLKRGMKTRLYSADDRDEKISILNHYGSVFLMYPFFCAMTTNNLLYNEYTHN